MRESLYAIVISVLLPMSTVGQEDYRPSASNPSGPETVAVFVTAEFCVGSRQPHMPETIEHMKRLLADRASKSGEGFSVIGVSLDWVPQEGVDHLAKFGAFDELIVGRNWFGVGATKFIWRDLPGTPATPQVLLLRREVTATERGVEISPSREILRIVGADKLKEWVDAGAPISK